MPITNPHVHTEQEIMNSSFDETLGVSMVEIIGADGNLVDLAGFNIPSFDYIALTYVAAGNGAGEIETVVYKKGGAGGTTVATLTLSYNASNEISSITKT